MGLLDIVRNYAGNQSMKPVTEAPVKTINSVPVKTVEVGSTGTQIYHGYLHEEYLGELRGRTWAEKIDQIRRSDPIARMILLALKLPLRSSHWFISETKQSQLDGTSADAEMQKRLIEQALFKDAQKPFKKLLGEILTMLDFGYSLFEITHQQKINDPELGTYTSLKSIGYRYQRTIERWNVDNDGNLQSVYQIAFGDLGRSCEMDSRFLLHFAPEAEGDNYEGVSVLRPIYGNWLRKNHFLKLLAAGIERFAIPTPQLEIPANKIASPEYDVAIRALKNYTSNGANYLTFPEGWKLTLFQGVFDAEKVRKAIDAENIEMANSILAGFLLLGQTSGGKGSHAQSKSLTEFYTDSIQYIADIVTEQLSRKIFEPLVKLNFGDQPLLVELKCDGLAENADEGWANMLKTLSDGGVMTPDDTLEKFVREKMQLPEIDEATRRAPPIAAGKEDNQLDPIQDDQKQQTLSEARAKKLATKRSSKQNEVSALIRQTEKELKAVYRPYLELIGKDFIKDIMKSKSKLKDDKSLRALLDTEATKDQDYSKAVKMLLTRAAYYSKEQVRALIPKSKAKKTLQEFKLAKSQTAKLSGLEEDMESALDNLQLAVDAGEADAILEAREAFAEIAAEATPIYMELGEFDGTILSGIQTRASFILDTQMADLEKNIGFQFLTSSPSTDSDAVLEKHLNDKLDDFLDSPVVNAGPDVLASQMVNQTRMDSIDELDAGDQVESFTFIAVDDDRTTELCSELDGHTFSADDPDADTYNPPLHYNCRSYLAINLKSFESNPEISDGKPTLTPEMQKQMNLSEQRCQHLTPLRPLKFKRR